MRFIKARNILSAPDPAWYRHHLADGNVYYTPERNTKRRATLVGPAERNPLPGELAEALNANPEADLDSSGRVLLQYSANESSDEPVILPPGVYSFEGGNHSNPDRLEPISLRSDSFLMLPGIYEKLVRDVQDFLGGKDVYRQFGFQHRRGLLLYGSPGNGKTCLIREIVRNIIPEQTTTIFMSHIPARSFIKVLQSTLANRMKVIIFEELAATLKASDIDDVLAFLDGENSLDCCLILATTNYPARLPGNIVDRPSRFDRLYQISDPLDEARKLLLENYLETKIGPTELELTRGLSVAGIREVCLLVKLRKLTIGDASKALKKHRDIVKREFAETTSIGLHARSRSVDYFDD